MNAKRLNDLTEVEATLTSKHEAAHVVVALALGLRVRYVPIKKSAGSENQELNGGVTCDWKTQRGVMDDIGLCEAAFAVAYAGAWLEAILLSRSFEDVFELLPTDNRMAADTRQCLTDWLGLQVKETYSISLGASKLAYRVISNEMPRIERLAEILNIRKVLDEAALREWFARDEEEHGKMVVPTRAGAPKIDHDHYCISCAVYWGCENPYCHLPTEEYCLDHGGGWDTEAVEHVHECLECEDHDEEVVSCFD
jgi:hypothetical protein